MNPTLEHAEFWMRHVAARGEGYDTDLCFGLVMGELDRLRALVVSPDERVERTETVAQLIHQYRHRAGTSATCGECSAVADSLTRVLLGAATQTPGPAAGRTTHTNSEQEADR